ncbi:tyrosine--tRNA ligase [Candidatus Gottesmanbacteria bacterium RIFCSPHIGHO2_02_FULL_39_11]|uniref:Tyrosine--tRNA ligase n=1 Tax=Candidatus Gottesmanbacteria bacterium RIFCSPHIGHO2_02_FULL_39_11 TaxID=1798382 RepID=A0A1F5ZW55_9BACT|nr:MAG: tyrosine--tRNA ligase [Candidatus Gottesmanbacteria bacterium RIFCSPHIGHO2_02_FULL_39_11]
MDSVDEVLTRGVETIYPSKEALAKVLRSGKKIRLYQGFDPTGIQLHLGHLAGLLKLSQFQKLGHEVIFLIGDGTGQAGDPSGKKRNRENYLSNEKLRENARDYVLQASKVVDFKGKNAVKIMYNGDWLNKLSLKETLDIAGHFTLAQLEERDMYQERRKEGMDINFREFLYPLLQGYDSVVMKVDLEIGGSDQMFNMLAGRKLVREMLNKEKFVLTLPLLADSTGKKIGKTEGNVIALTSKPNELFGMIMNLPDEVIGKCFEMITNLPIGEVEIIQTELKMSDNPMPHKKKLAYELVRMLNTQKEAKESQDYFENTFQKKNTPDDIPKAAVVTGEYTIIDLINSLGIFKSKSDIRRLISEGAVDIDGKNIKDISATVTVDKTMTIKLGKHKFVKIIPT